MLERTDRALSDAFSMAGIGLMGSNMPLWLLDAGYRVTVWNRTPAKMAPALAKGAQAGRSAADVTDRSDVIQLCLTDTRAVEAVVFGPARVAAGGAARSLRRSVT